MELEIWRQPPTGTGHGGGQEQGVQEPVLCGVWDACGLLCLLPPFLTAHRPTPLYSVFQDNLFWILSRAQIKGIQLFKVVMLSFYSWDVKRSVSNMEEALVVRRELRVFPTARSFHIRRMPFLWKKLAGTFLSASRLRGTLYQTILKSMERNASTQNNERQASPLGEITQNHDRSRGVQKRKRL